MRKTLKTIVLVLIGAIILVFALSNRQTVVFSLDPLGSLDPTNPFVFAAPLFVLAIALVMVGVIVGGVFTWFRQGKWRKLARQNESEARNLRAENESLKRELEVRAEPSVPQIAPPASGFTLTRSE